MRVVGEGRPVVTPQLALALDDSSDLSPATRPAPARHLCAGCRQRPARFQYRGHVKADRSHTLCFQCYRAAMDRVRRGVRPPVPSAADTRYEELARRRRRAQIAARHALAAIS